MLSRPDLWRVIKPIHFHNTHSVDLALRAENSISAETPNRKLLERKNRTEIIRLNESSDQILDASPQLTSPEPGTQSKINREVI